MRALEQERRREGDAHGWESVVCPDCNFLACTPVWYDHVSATWRFFSTMVVEIGVVYANLDAFLKLWQSVPHGRLDGAHA